MADRLRLQEFRKFSWV
ncbi:MAG TPA: hypothetical protein VJ889_31530 [Pseudomonas sp.]|nr:hypothetical protein [Pseudomonas sp.]